MSNTNARASFGSYFKFSSLSTGTLNTLAGITKITPFKAQRGVIDITDMNSTDYWQDQTFAGPIKSGQINMTMNYISTDTAHTGTIQNCLENGTKIGWAITLAGTSSNNIWYGDGYITEYSLGDLTIDGKVEFNLGLVIKGKPTGPVSTTT